MCISQILFLWSQPFDTQSRVLCYSTFACPSLSICCKHFHHTSPIHSNSLEFLEWNCLCSLVFVINELCSYDLFLAWMLHFRFLFPFGRLSLAELFDHELFAFPLLCCIWGCHFDLVCLLKNYFDFAKERNARPQDDSLREN